MNYHNITKDDMKNGDGLRVVLWVAGCGHHCPGCQNPETWDENGGIPFDKDAETDLRKKLSPKYIQGITFSGGDPMYPGNRSEILRICKFVREDFPNRDIWLYTGYLFEEIKDDPIIRLCDVVVDGRYDASKRDVSLPWVGSKNQRVIDVKESLKSGAVILHRTEEADGSSLQTVTPCCGC